MYEKMTALPGDIPMGVFIWLDNDRFDIIAGNVSVLGGTLFTNPPEDNLAAIDRLYKDIIKIPHWDPDDHVAGWRECSEFLAREVKAIEREDPQRTIIILTHHCPSRDRRVLGPFYQHDPRGRSHRWTTDMSKHPAWTSPNVKLWAFGATNVNCNLAHGPWSKRVYSNQRGHLAECANFDAGRVVDVELVDDDLD
ncbi:hypothetical protein AAE478_001641 [Parahypoxylon ruwenzoriense]